jgi:hypothetical protein
VSAEDRLSFVAWCDRCRLPSKFTLDKIITEGTRVGSREFVCGCPHCRKATFSFLVSEEAQKRLKKQKEESRP